MKHHKSVATFGVVLLGAAAAYVIYRQLTSNPAEISGVTQSTKSGPSGALTTSPINRNNVAFVAASSTLDTLAAIPTRVGTLLRGLFIPNTTDKRQPYGNPESAFAAYNTNRDQLAGNYSPKVQIMV